MCFALAHSISISILRTIGNEIGGSNVGSGETYRRVSKTYYPTKTYYATRKYIVTASPRLHFPDENLEMQSGSGSVERGRSVCTKKPKTIMNASVRCTLMSNTCKAVCKEGYQFPTGETLLNVLCEGGEWSLEKYEWSDKLSCEREFPFAFFFPRF